MKNQIAKIGIITYKNYSENVLLNETFVLADLIKIINEDTDFVKFEVLGAKNEILLTTDTRADLVTYFNVDTCEHVTEIVRVLGDEEKGLYIARYDETFPILLEDILSRQPNSRILEFPTVVSNTEILGTTYNAYAKVPFKHKVKYTYSVSTRSGHYTKKAHAIEMAKRINDRSRLMLEKV